MNDGGNSFGCVWGDYDADGDLDLFVANRLDQKNFLYRNDGNSNHWLKVRLIGTESNRSGIGAKVRVKATIGRSGRAGRRGRLPAQTGYNSQNLEQHFGLKDAAVAESLLVEWPSGQVDRFVMLGVDRLIRIVEGEGATGIEAPARGALEVEAIQVGYGPPILGEASVAGSGVCVDSGFRFFRAARRRGRHGRVARRHARHVARFDGSSRGRSLFLSSDGGVSRADGADRGREVRNAGGDDHRRGPVAVPAAQK